MITLKSDWLHWASGGPSFCTGLEVLLFHILCNASHTRDSGWVLRLQNHNHASFGWVPNTTVHNLPNVMNVIVNAYMWVFICLPSHVSTCVNPHISICLLLLFFQEACHICKCLSSCLNDFPWVRVSVHDHWWFAGTCYILLVGMAGRQRDPMLCSHYVL